MRALVLSGGGAAGAYEAGVVCGLARSGQRFDLVCGTSIGALSGALYAQDDVAALERVWHTIVARRPLRPLPRVGRLRDLVERLARLGTDSFLQKLIDVARAASDVPALLPLRGLLELTGTLDALPVIALLQAELRFDRLARSLVVATTNVTRTTCDPFVAFAGADAAERAAQFELLQPSSHGLNARNYRDAVRASAAVPGAFSPVTIALDDAGGDAGDAFVDGGIANDTPLGLAIDAGARDLTIVFLDPANSAGEAMPVANLVQIAYASLAVVRRRILEADLKAAEHVNAAIDAGGLPQKHRVRLRAIRPSTPLGVPFFGFDDQPALDAAFARGVADGGRL